MHVGPYASIGHEGSCVDRLFFQGKLHNVVSIQNLTYRLSSAKGFLVFFLFCPYLKKNRVS